MFAEKGYNVQECDATEVHVYSNAGNLKKIFTMKKTLLIALIVFTRYNTDAQVMQQKAQWATISMPQLKCWVCKEKVDQFLLTEKGPNGDAGIVQWKIAMNTGTLRIQYVPDRITLDYIRTTLNNAGYDADSTKAEPDAYKMLPPICKRAEDGGGPQKGKPCNLPPDEQ